MHHTNFGKNHTKFDVEWSQFIIFKLTFFNTFYINNIKIYMYLCRFKIIHMEHKPGQHVQVPNSVSKLDGRKTRKEYNDLNIYAQLKKYMNSVSKIAVVSTARLAEDCDMSNQGIINALKRLEKAGDIEKIKVGKCNGYRFNTKSEKFEMYDYEFLKNKALDSKQKAFMIAVQKYLYVDKETGVAKTTYSDRELSQMTGISESTIYRRVNELINSQFVVKRTTTDNDGNVCEALEFNLPKFGQFVLCKLQQHDIIIAQQQMELEKLRSEMSLVKKLLTGSIIETEEIEM